jgi:hypothetical protein
MQEMTADRVVIGFDVDPLAVMAPVIPIEQHRSEARHQSVGDVARAGRGVIAFFGNDCTEHRDRGAHDVHRMRGGRNLLERDFDGRRDAARINEFRLVGRELAYRRQRAVHEQIRDLLEFADIGDVEDVVAAVMQIVAGAPDGAKLGVAGNDTGKRD